MTVLKRFHLMFIYTSSLRIKTTLTLKKERTNRFERDKEKEEKREKK